jgi:predicted  nucleic acid-binding Zn-ribbon protein
MHPQTRAALGAALMDLNQQLVKAENKVEQLEEELHAARAQAESTRERIAAIEADLQGP